MKIAEQYITERRSAGAVLHYNAHGIAGEIETTGNPGIRGTLKNVNPHWQAPGAESQRYPTFSERVAWQRANRANLIEREKQDCDINRIAFALAYRVRSHFLRTRLGWNKSQIETLERAERTRKTGTYSARGKRFIRDNLDGRKGLSVEISPDSIEEAALSARAVLVANWHLRDADGKFPTSTDTNGKGFCPVIRDANRAARKAFNREEENPLPEPENCGFVPESVTDSPERDALRVYANAVRRIRAYWRNSESRKAKAGLRGDLQRLRLIAEFSLGKGEVKPKQTASVRKGLQRMREHLQAGEMLLIHGQ